MDASSQAYEDYKDLKPVALAPVYPEKPWLTPICGPKAGILRVPMAAILRYRTAK
jgi:hypothetical protein